MNQTEAECNITQEQEVETALAVRVASALRALAVLVEKHPELSPLRFNISTWSSTPDELKSKLYALLSGGLVTKRSWGNAEGEAGRFIELSLDLGAGVVVNVYTEKMNSGCRKVKVEKMVTTEEWQCGPLLDQLAEVK